LEWVEGGRQVAVHLRVLEIPRQDLVVFSAVQHPDGSGVERERKRGLGGGGSSRGGVNNLPHSAERRRWQSSRPSCGPGGDRRAPWRCTCQTWPLHTKRKTKNTAPQRNASSPLFTEESSFDISPLHFLFLFLPPRLLLKKATLSFFGDLWVKERLFLFFFFL
jgi:hypothetical protein